ncbi:MAG: hypothetical protein FJW96_04320 [Actinobacteria bacterium]|nr:hypothetical protein [Actinomycetota bacterium]
MVGRPVAMRQARTWLTGLVVGAAFAVTGPASAATFETSFQLLQMTPSGVWDETGGLPFLFPPGTGYRYRAGANTYVGQWIPASVSRGSIGEALAEVYEDSVGRFPQGNEAVITDRRLTATEAARFTVLADLYRDGDVLVVAAGHPACAGLTIDQARRIANGTIARWSQVVRGAAVDRIAVRYLQMPGAEFPIPRLGTRFVGQRTSWRVDYARSGKGAPDGGVGEAAAGNQGVVAITTWSRLRATRPGSCVVPLDGVEPTNATIASLRYPGAFPVSCVVTRKVAGRDAVARGRIVVMRRAMRAKLLSEGRKALRSRGLLVVGDPVPPG